MVKPDGSEREAASSYKDDDKRNGKKPKKGPSGVIEVKGDMESGGAPLSKRMQELAVKAAKRAKREEAAAAAAAGTPAGEAANKPSDNGS